MFGISPSGPYGFMYSISHKCVLASFIPWDTCSLLKSRQEGTSSPVVLGASRPLRNRHPRPCSVSHLRGCRSWFSGPGFRVSLRGCEFWLCPMAVHPIHGLCLGASLSSPLQWGVTSVQTLRNQMWKPLHWDWRRSYIHHWGGPSSSLKAVSTATRPAFSEAVSLFPQSVKHVRTSLNPCWGRSCCLRCGGQQRSRQRSQRLMKGWGKEGWDDHGEHRAQYYQIGGEHQLVNYGFQVLFRK